MFTVESNIWRKVSFTATFVLLSCGVCTPAALPPLPPYPKGIWAAYGAKATISTELVNNLGVVGVGISEDWSVVNPAPGVYDWTTLDNKIAQAKAAGFKINLVISNSSEKTPTWLLDDSLPVNPVRINLVDPSPQHTAYCTPVKTCLYWDPVFQQARLDLIAAAGAHFSDDPEIVAVTAQFANQHSNDFNILDNVFPVGAELQCPACPTTAPELCGPQVLDQPAQWLAAGFTEQKMAQVGKEMMDAYAAAFPNKNIKLPIGGMADTLIGDFSTLARDIEDYVYGNVSLGITARTYAGRFWMQRNTVQADWEPGTTYDTKVPGFDADKYIRYMIRKHAKPAELGGLTPGHAGLQMIEAATGGANSCRQGDGEGGPCDNLATSEVECPEICVMQASLDVARTFGVTYIEIFPQDAQNPAFYSMITAATVAMGGTPRGGSGATPPPTPQGSTMLNVSTRVDVQSGDSVMIGGFIIQGDTAKRVVLRAIGPSLAALGVNNVLADPILELYDSTGALIQQNDNWSSLSADVIASGLTPKEPGESVITANLAPGSYTAVLRGVNGSAGVALCELYDLEPANSRISNISTRGVAGPGDSAMIGGFIIGGVDPAKVLVRAIGPSLTAFGISGALPDPILELRNSDGSLLFENDNWGTDQKQQIIDSTIPPTDDRESAIVATLAPGSYTAVVHDAADSTGVALVEIYALEN